MTATATAEPRLYFITTVTATATAGSSLYFITTETATARKGSNLFKALSVCQVTFQCGVHLGAFNTQTVGFRFSILFPFLL